MLFVKGCLAEVFEHCFIDIIIQVITWINTLYLGVLTGMTVLAKPAHFGSNWLWEEFDLRCVWKSERSNQYRCTIM